MKHLLTILLALTCATAFAQSVIVKATGAGAVHATGAGSVRGVAVIPPTGSNYCDGRFVVWDANTNVVVDNDSGLMWTRDANLGGTMDWTNAVDYCDNLTNATYSDWRLPSIAEFSRSVATNGLADAYPSANSPALPLGHPFNNVSVEIYWSSTEFGDTYAYYLLMDDGTADYFFKTTDFYRVWPCRGP